MKEYLSFAENIIDILNADKSFNTDLLYKKKIATLKNKTLLLYRLSDVLNNKTCQKYLFKMYNTENLQETVKKFVEEKCQLLKKLEIYSHF
jgi:flagella basal body P-ring formation protein FlgA